MGRFRVRFTIRRIMTVVVVLGIVMAALVRLERHRSAAVWQDRLAKQQIVTNGAEAAYLNARLTREVSEIAVTEYVESMSKPDPDYADGELRIRLEDALIDQGQTNRERAEDRLDGSRPRRVVDLFMRNWPRSEQRLAQRAGFTPEQARTKKEVLEKWIKETRLTAQICDVEGARADEAAKKAAYDREKSALKSLLQEGSR